MERRQQPASDVRFADLPQVEGPQGRFLLNSMVAVAELEAGLISQRTKAALAAAKSAGALGGDRGQRPSRAARRAGAAARRASPSVRPI